MRVSALLAALLLLTPLAARAKPKTAASQKPAKESSSDGRFSYGTPKGFEHAVLKNAVAGWTHAKSKNIIGVFPVSPERAKTLGGALKAANTSRERASAKQGGWIVSKVYKKTLENKMDFLFYSAHQNGKNLKIAGYFALGANLYFVSGWVPRTKYGMPALYAALDTIEPIAAPRGGRAMAGHETPSLLKQQEEKTKGPSGVKLDMGSGTPKMLGGPQKTGGPVR